MAEQELLSICELCGAELDPLGPEAVKAVAFTRTPGEMLEEVVVFHATCYPTGSPRYKRLDAATLR